MVWFVTAAFAATAVDRSLDVPGDATVSVSVPCGSVRITGSDRKTVHLSGTLPGPESLDVSVSSGRVVVEVAEAPLVLDTCVDLVLEVPAASNLEVDGLAASVVIDGMRACVEVESISGAVTVSGAPRSVTIETVSGEVKVSGATQRIELESVSGTLSADGVGGAASLESVSGAIALVGGSPFTEAELSTVSGNVAVTAALAPSGSLEAATHSGRMRVRLPADTDARLSQSTFSGALHDVFGPGEELVLGAGKGRIELSTFSGELVVEHR